MTRIPVDTVAIESRAASFATRSIQKGAKQRGLRMVVSMLDLTTLEGKDSAGTVRALCQKALFPDTSLPSVPPVAAVCVYPHWVALARQQLAASPVRVASVAAAFPSGQVDLKTKLCEVKDVVRAGADEIDMVLNRGAFLAGDFALVATEIRAVKKLCGGARLKVILETGELETYDNVSHASAIAIAEGAHFLKTSTGKISPASTMPMTLVMLEVIRRHFLSTGKRVGMKSAGGIRTAQEALHYLVMVKETLGDAWLCPQWFRFGASSLLNDVLLQMHRQKSGHCAASYDV